MKKMRRENTKANKCWFVVWLNNSNTQKCKMLLFRTRLKTALSHLIICNTKCTKKCYYVPNDDEYIRFVLYFIEFIRSKTKIPLPSNFSYALKWMLCCNCLGVFVIFFLLSLFFWSHSLFSLRSVFTSCYAKCTSHIFRLLCCCVSACVLFDIPIQSTTIMSRECLYQSHINNLFWSYSDPYKFNIMVL